MQTQIQCPQCGAPVMADVQQVIDVGQAPQLKTMLLNGQLNMAQCRSCGWSGMLGTPMVYHDPEHELLMTFVPMEMNIGVQEREQMVGSMVRQVVDNTPMEKRRGYMLNPQPVLQWKTFIEKVLETEGVTPEMIQRQQKQMELLQKLATVDSDVAEILLDDNKRLIDETFFAIMQQAVESLSQSQQPAAQSQLIKLTNIRAELMTSTEVGMRLEQRSLALHSLNMAAKKAGGLSPELLLTHILKHKQDAGTVDALVGAGQSALSYEFFALFSAEIERATDPVDVKLLSDLRTRLLKQYDDMREQTNRILGAASATLDAILSADDRQAAIMDNLERIDEPFMYVLQAEREQAERAGDVAHAEALAQIEQEIAALAQNAMPPEVMLINELMMAPDRATVQQIMDENAEMVTPEFVDALRTLSAELENQGQNELKARLDQVRSMAASRILA